MYVGGSVISSVEFHGNMSLVIFMSGCPLTCRYCHNVELLEDTTEKTFEEVKQEIDSSADFLDAVVISGGEPLLQPDFVAYKFADRKNLGNFFVRKVWGVQGVTWTLKTPEQHKTAVEEGWIPIFEDYEP